MGIKKLFKILEKYGKAPLPQIALAALLALATASDPIQSEPILQIVNPANSLMINSVVQTAFEAEVKQGPFDVLRVGVAPRINGNMQDDVFSKTFPGNATRLCFFGEDVANSSMCDTGEWLLRLKPGRYTAYVEGVIYDPNLIVLGDYNDLEIPEGLHLPPLPNQQFLPIATQ